MHFFLRTIYGQIFLNAYFIWRGVRVLPAKSVGRKLFILFIIIELLLYFSGYFFYKDLPDTILHFIMTVCNTWLIASTYFISGLLVIDILGITIRKIRKSTKKSPSMGGAMEDISPFGGGRGRCSPFIGWARGSISPFAESKGRCSSSMGGAMEDISPFGGGRGRCSHFIGWALFLIVAALMLRGYYNAVYPVVRHLDIHIPKIIKGRDSLTVVMMSDLHISRAIGKKHIQRIVERCNAEHPDIILIAGDILDYESRFAEQEHIEDDLKRLSAPLGVYMTLGNHEYRANRFAKIRWLEKTGVILLVDSVAMPDSTFYLIGRDDPINCDRATMETLIQKIDKTKPVILFEHQPVLVEELIDNQCDLGLYGHMHNGQYWPLPLLMKIFFKYLYGLYIKDNTHIYVSAGAGFAGPPFRIGTRSEIVVLRLRFNQL